MHALFIFTVLLCMEYFFKAMKWHKLCHYTALYTDVVNETFEQMHPLYRKIHHLAKSHNSFNTILIPAFDKNCFIVNFYFRIVPYRKSMEVALYDINTVSSFNKAYVLLKTQTLIFPSTYIRACQGCFFFFTSVLSSW